jgi:hypothetical protein
MNVLIEAIIESSSMVAFQHCIQAYLTLFFCYPIALFFFYVFHVYHRWRTRNKVINYNVVKSVCSAAWLQAFLIHFLWHGCLIYRSLTHFSADFFTPVILGMHLYLVSITLPIIVQHFLELNRILSKYASTSYSKS